MGDLSNAFGTNQRADIGLQRELGDQQRQVDQSYRLAELASSDGAARRSNTLGRDDRASGEPHYDHERELDHPIEPEPVQPAPSGGADRREIGIRAVAFLRTTLMNATRQLDQLQLEPAFQMA